MSWWWKRPTDEAYCPRLLRGEAPREPVRPALRGLRLRRRRIARMGKTPLVFRVLLLILAMGAIYVFVVRGLILRSDPLLPW